MVDMLQRSNSKLRRFVLDNGMVVLLKEDHSAPVVAIQVWVGAGSIYEDEHLGCGLSHFVEHMIFKGTPTRSPGDISRQISDVGGDMNAYTSTDRTVFYVKLPSHGWRTGLDVLSDAVMHASFPEDEWQREQEVILREFAMGRDDPLREHGKLLWETAYRVHPYRIPVIGYENLFKSVTHDDLVSYFRSQYTPDNMILVFVGAAPIAEVEAAVRSTFNDFARRARPARALPVEPTQLAPRVSRKTGPHQVGRVHKAWHTVALSHPDAPTLDVLAVIVGSGRSSRLAREIKEKKRLVHNISAWSSTPGQAGLFGISAMFDPANEKAALDAIDAEVASWREKPFTPAEIEKARRMVLVNELSSLETMDGQASNYGVGEFYAGDPCFSERYIAAVEQVTAESLTDVVQRYLTHANSTTAILAPAGEEAAATEEAAVSTPKVQKVTLSNGVVLLVRPDHRLPFVHLCVVLRGGLLSETEADNGISQLTADLLTRGTDTRSAEDIAQSVESLGASLSSFSGRHSFGLQARSLSSDVETLTELTADCLLHAAFPEDQFAQQRTVQLAALRQQRENPMFVADDALRQALYPGHPYRWTPLGTEKSLEALTPDALRAYFKKLAVSGNLVLSFFGDIDVEKARSLAETYFGKLPKGEVEDAKIAAPQPTLPTRVKKREPKQQAVLLVGYPSVDLRDPRTDALRMIEETLSGLSSELMIEVRDRKGLVYYLGASSRPGLGVGAFQLYAGTREDQAPEVERLINVELQRLAEKGLSTVEWQRAREQILAEHEMRMQSNGTLAQICALDEILGLGYEHAFSVRERLDALTPEQVRAVAADLLQPERQVVSLVLPEQPTENSEEQP